IEALGKLGGRAAVDALLACVESDHFFRTFPAIDVLGRSGDPRAVAPLARLLGDSRYALEAARALGRSGDRRAVAPLFHLLLSPSDGNVRVACVALVELWNRHAQLYGSTAAVEEGLRRAGTEAVVRRLGQCSARADKAERLALCTLLGLLQRESAMPMLSTLLDADADVAEAASMAVIEISRANESVLTEALRVGGDARRKALLPFVTQRSAVAAVLTCLEDASAEVRVAACAALARIGAVSSVPELFAQLGHANARVVNAAVAAIQSLGSDQTEELALRAVREPRTRRAALRVLAYFGFHSALPYFAQAASEHDPRVRDVAFQGLVLIERAEARDVLLGYATAEDATIRASALRALGHSDDASLTPALLAATHDADAWVRYYACQALGRRRTPTVEPELEALVNDSAGQVRVAAIEALSQLGSAAAVRALRAFAEHSDPDLRRAALVGLGLAADDLSLATLLGAAREGDGTTRLVALSALTRFSDARVVELWLDTARHAPEPLRVAAINLLAHRPDALAARALVQLLLEAGESELLVSALIRDVAERVSALQLALAQADDDQARTLVTCIARSKARGAEAALYQAVISTNLATRRAAVSALSGLNTRPARALLAEIAAGDPDPELRRISSLQLETN
ncbi:MAG TPA: HEAT repeat domain-containing protein, partial [Polyangiales bacterium]